MIGFKKNKKIVSSVLLLIFSLILVHFIVNSNIIVSFTNNYKDKDEIPRVSATWGWINLTNYRINGTRHYHNDVIIIEGRLFYLPTNKSLKGYSISLKVDGIILPLYTDTTNKFGMFRFDYTIPSSSNIYSNHKFEAVVNNPGGDVFTLNYFIINSKSYSNFANLIYNKSVPLLTGEHFVLNGELRYLNGSNIPFAIINYYWFDGTSVLSGGVFLSNSAGFFTDIMIVVPNTVSNPLTLKLNYSNNPFVDYCEIIIGNIEIFSGINWDLEMEYTTTEGADYILRGTLTSNTNSSLKIYNRVVEIFYNSTSKGTSITDSSGTFSHIFNIPMQNGTASIQVQLVNDAGKTISSPIQYILVEPLPQTTPLTPELPPFLLFSLIFFPILASIIAGLAVYGYKFYRKQEEESRAVNVPLESKIVNLKILKDSGRLEESISYLFNAIFMDLINAKYNRFRKDNETIRDFAIVSVKELKLTPSSIYPFIQKVEETVYAKPFKITEKDFYNTCDLFSPIYFQLTGYHFVLNF